MKFGGAGHQADGTSRRIFSYKFVQYDQFENFIEEFWNFMIFLY